ncbi:hypothetical protein Q9R19_00105 [Microbacterium sp. ARD32]|uniref:hypothetical protein n=1 Tax=Microbacterium sp. ARD32 TaxID=2962577 RepID=UPI002881E10A|nr:hypothetical protein [Microbacterium sp. ARD32]MDT0156021.1 hypothetical protein [Microbacterium sp. ARD32]
MYQDSFSVYRVIVFELEQAAARAEHQRVISERTRVVPRRSLRQRMLRRFALRRRRVMPADA